MSVTRDIIAEAEKLFDGTGVVPDGENSIVIVGLATSPGRDLDYFVRGEDGTVEMPGFEAYIRHPLELLTASIRRLGLNVAIMGTYGYPEGYELNLKRQAVAAGMVSWGKNAMVLHPAYGPRLRLAALKITGTILEGTGPGLDGFMTNQLCDNCNACIDACPQGVLDPYYVHDRRNCLANISWSTDPGTVDCCNRCWLVCPQGIARE